MNEIDWFDLVTRALKRAGIEGLYTDGDTGYSNVDVLSEALLREIECVGYKLVKQ